MDDKENIYALDIQNNQVIKIDSRGVKTILAGGGPGRVGPGEVEGRESPGEFEDGTGREARFNRPSGLTMDSQHENLYIADKYNSVIRKLNLENLKVEKLAGVPGVLPSVYKDQLAHEDVFKYPMKIVIDSKDSYLYIADLNPYKHLSNKKSKIARLNLADSSIETVAEVKNITSLEIDPEDNFLYIGGNWGPKFKGGIRKLNLETKETTEIIRSSDESVIRPIDLTLDWKNKNLYILDFSGSVFQLDLETETLLEIDKCHLKCVDGAILFKENKLLAANFSTATGEGIFTEILSFDIEPEEQERSSTLYFDYAAKTGDNLWQLADERVDKITALNQADIQRHKTLIINAIKNSEVGLNKEEFEREDSNFLFTSRSYKLLTQQGVEKLAKLVIDGEKEEVNKIANSVFPDKDNLREEYFKSVMILEPTLQKLIKTQEKKSEEKVDGESEPAKFNLQPVPDAEKTLRGFLEYERSVYRKTSKQLDPIDYTLVIDEVGGYVDELRLIDATRNQAPEFGKSIVYYLKGRETFRKVGVDDPPEYAGYSWYRTYAFPEGIFIGIPWFDNRHADKPKLERPPAVLATEESKEDAVRITKLMVDYWQKKLQ